MTAEPDLLPLPEYLRADYKRMATDSHEAECKHYARANVAHATAAKDAEIEALRAEVERLKALVRSVGYETLDRAEQAEALAERLAEALRGARARIDHVVHGDAGMETLLEVYDLMTAALHPTAAQEGEESFWPKLPGSGGPDWTGHD